MGVGGVSWTGHRSVTEVPLPRTPATSVPPLSNRKTSHLPDPLSVHALLPEPEDRPLLPDTTPRAGLRRPRAACPGGRECARLRFNQGRPAARPAPASCLQTRQVSPALKKAPPLCPPHTHPTMPSVPSPLFPLVTLLLSMMLKVTSALPATKDWSHLSSCHPHLCKAAGTAPAPETPPALGLLLAGLPRPAPAP